MTLDLWVGIVTGQLRLAAVQAVITPAQWFTHAHAKPHYIQSELDLSTKTGSGRLVVSMLHEFVQLEVASLVSV